MADAGQSSTSPPTRFVDKIEQGVGEKVGGALQNPVLGFILNPALELATKIDDQVFEPILEEASALSPALQGQVAQQNPNQSWFQNWRMAREYANEVSFGQAWSSVVTPSTIAPGMDDINLLDTQEREDYYKDDPIAWAISGSLDLAAMAAISKGTGSAWKAGRKAVFGNRMITSPTALKAFENRVDTAAEFLSENPKPSFFSNATTKLMYDVTQESDATKLLNNSLVAASNNPNRAATILSRLTDPKDVANYLKAERGNRKALEDLWNSQPTVADTIDDHGIRLNRPLTDFTEIRALPDQQMSKRLVAILDDLKKRDPELAGALDNFTAEKAQGVALSNYQPARNYAWERMNSSKARVKATARFGDAEILGKPEEGDFLQWRSRLYQSSPYDRAVRVITFMGDGRAQGHIDISGPRRYDGVWQIMSEINRIDFLKGRKGAEFKRSLIAEYTSAANDTERMMALSRIEQRILLKMAERFQVRGLGEVHNNQEAVDLIEQWHKNMSSHRKSATEYLRDNGMIPDEDGVINVVQLPIRAHEPSSVPMLDFKRLEQEIQLQMKRNIRNNNFSDDLDPKMQSTARIRASRATMGAGQFFDTINMFFSNINLLRLGYPPKNAIVDPVARASMDTNTMFGINTLFPGTVNVMHNRAMAARRTGMVIGDKFMPNQRKIRRDFDRQSNELTRKRAQLEKNAGRVDELQARLDEIGKIKRSRSAKTKAQYDSNMKNEEVRLGDEIDTLRQQNDIITRFLPTAEKALEDTRGLMIARESKKADLKKDRWRVGQTWRDIKVDGDTYALERGLADDNVKGAKAYRASIDAFEDGYKASRRSEISNKISAQRNEWIDISIKNWDAYRNALTHIANRGLRNELDEFGGMVLRGKTKAEVRDWLKNTQMGREYLTRMSSRMNLRSQKAIDAWIEKTHDDILRMYPDQNLRDTILRREITADEIDAYLRGRTDLPNSIKGPDIAQGLRENLTREFGTQFKENPLGMSAHALGTFTDVGWKFFGAIETNLARNPLFLKYTQEEMQYMIKAARNVGKDADGKWIVDVNNREALEKIRQAAYRNAVERVEQTMYTVRRMSNAGYYARYLMSFPQAFFNSQFWAIRAMARNPANAMWLASVANVLDGFDMYYDDQGNSYKEASQIPKGANAYISFPMSNALGKVPFAGDSLVKWWGDTPYGDKRGGGTQITAKQFQFMIGDPTVGWFTNMLISDAVKFGLNIGPFKANGEQIDGFFRDAVGDATYEENILLNGKPSEGENPATVFLNSLGGTWLKTAANAAAAFFNNSETGAFGSNSFTADVGSITQKGIEQAHREGKNSPNPEEIVKAAGLVQFFKAVIQMGSPVSVKFDPVTRSAHQAFQTYMDDHGGDYNAARDAFVDDWGVEALALIADSMNENTAGLMPTKNNLDMVREYPDLMRQIYENGGKDAKAAELAGMIAFTDGSENDEYDTLTAEIFKVENYPGATFSLKEQQSIQDLLGNVETKIGWQEFMRLKAWRDSIMAQYGISSTSEKLYQTSGLKGEYNRQLAELKGRNVSWANAFDETRSNWWGRSFRALNDLASNDKWIESQGQKGQEIREYVGQLSTFRQQLDEVNNSPVPQPDAAKMMKIQFAVWSQDFVLNASPEFQAFADRWINVPELDEFEQEAGFNG